MKNAVTHSYNKGNVYFFYELWNILPIIIDERLNHRILSGTIFSIKVYMRGA